MTLETTTLWTISVSKETDIALRTFLTQRGMKKGDISKFVEEAVKWRVFDETLAEVARNSRIYRPMSCKRSLMRPLKARGPKCILPRHEDSA